MAGLRALGIDAGTVGKLEAKSKLSNRGRYHEAMTHAKANGFTATAVSGAPEGLD
jgi:hypothetical protein